MFREWLLTVWVIILLQTLYKHQTVMYWIFKECILNYYKTSHLKAMNNHFTNIVWKTVEWSD